MIASEFRDPVVEPTDTNALTTAVVLDVRDADAFSASRLRAAVRVPIERWEAAAKLPETLLDNGQFWAGEIGRLGVTPARPAIVYDDGRLTEAARVWFILQYFGISARIVNGGWPAIASLAPSLVETGPPKEPAGAAFFAIEGSGPVGLVGRHQLRPNLETALQIFDARTRAEFAGEDLRKNVRGGHLPCATSLPHADLLDERQWLRPADDLARILAAAGFRSSDRLVTHCDGGGRAALAAMAALRAGFTNVDAYYLSFSDWAKDESCPVVRD